MEEKLEFEQALKELDEIVNKISNNKVSLDESLALYERGQEIIKRLEEMLKEAESKVEKVIDIE